jgi:hypothetical protein
MRISTVFLFLPCMVLLGVLAIFNFFRGDRAVARAILIGVIGGLFAAVAYDVFRLPFVFSREWGLASVFPPLQLFKVFPRFGAMILGQPIEQSNYSNAAQVVGWAYHFSNGATFGVMYLALIGDAVRRHWVWGVVMALALELGMLVTPYPAFFNIAVTPHFIGATLAAHAIFGACLGLTVLWLGKNRCRIAGGEVEPNLKSPF